jgi:hypothetical protein
MMPTVTCTVTDKHSRWNAVLFTEVFSDLSGLVVVAALLLIVLAAVTVVLAVAAALAEAPSAPLPRARHVQPMKAPLSTVSSAMTANEQQAIPYKLVIDTFVAVAAAALTAVEEPLVLQPLSAPQRALLPTVTPSQQQQQQQLAGSSVIQADEEQERLYKELLEKCLFIWSDKHYVWSDTHIHCGQQ